MATASPKIPPLPAPSEPFTLADGKINPVWYRWLTQFVAIMQTVRSEV